MASAAASAKTSSALVPDAERWFLSEMAVSDGHGGGLTLQRVIGDDLGHFAGFVHPGRFGEKVPPAPAYRARSSHLPMSLESDVARRYLGCRPSAWLAGSNFLRQRYADRVAAMLAAVQTPRRWLVCPQGDLTLRIVERLKRRGTLDYVTWMMDDHLVGFHAATGSWRYRPEHQDLLRAHLRGARAVFVISPVMQEFYAREFGVESTVLFGPGDPIDEPVWTLPTGPSEPLHLGYFGSIGPWQNDALALLLPTVAEGEATLDIFSAHRLPTEWASSPGLCRHDPLPAAEVRGAMRRCAAVLLPISFLPGMANMTRLNIATKMAECLASGTVVLLIGPPEAAMTRYLLGTGAALLVTSPTPEAVNAKLAQLRDASLRRDTLAAARRLCLECCTAGVMRERWRHATQGLFD